MQLVINILTRLLIMPDAAIYLISKVPNYWKRLSKTSKLPADMAKRTQSFIFLRMYADFNFYQKNTNYWVKLAPSILILLVAL